MTHRRPLSDFGAGTAVVTMYDGGVNVGLKNDEPLFEA